MAKKAAKKATKKAPAKKAPAKKAPAKKAPAKKAAAAEDGAVATAEKPAAESTVKGAGKASTGKKKMIRITQVKSQIGFQGRQKKVLTGLGLGRIGRSVTRPDDACIRGMVAKVSHLVRVENVEG
ncbi:MAG TPA: 50S ribosomal protein L30 [Candidatus Sulfomarinibacteraceae bacterium]|nr:50S ribosomal protein L30 [Candidatus Sulfomarinibacteraceae bacterium]